MFRRKFWVSLLLSLPVLFFSPSLQEWLGAASAPDLVESAENVCGVPLLAVVWAARGVRGPSGVGDRAQLIDRQGKEWRVSKDGG